MGRYSDNTSQSGDSNKDAARAEHDARDDAVKDGTFERGNSSKNSERFSRDSSAGKSADSLWSKIFG